LTELSKHSVTFWKKFSLSNSLISFLKCNELFYSVINLVRTSAMIKLKFCTTWIKFYQLPFYLDHRIFYACTARWYYTEVWYLITFQLKTLRCGSKTILLIGFLYGLKIKSLERYPKCNHKCWGSLIEWR
jgi:hypothetical protein